MNTPRPSPHFQPAAAPFHISTRTALSVNTDPQTGRGIQALSTMRLEMSWRSGELHIEFRANAITMDTDRLPPRRERLGRKGNL